MLSALIGIAMAARELPTVLELPMDAFCISGDGKIVAGSVRSGEGSLPCVWTAKGGIRRLPIPEGCKWGNANLISGDGRTVFGSYTLDNHEHACYWKGNKPPILLPEVIQYRDLVDISWDGSVAVGRHGPPFLWTAANGIQYLKPDPVDRLFLAPRCISADGRVIAGCYGGRPLPSEWGKDNSFDALYGSAPFKAACIWKSDQQPFSIPQPQRTHFTDITDVSADGKIFCGEAGVPGGTRLFRWTEKDGIDWLWAQKRTDESFDGRITADGRTIVGTRYVGMQRDVCFWFMDGQSATLKDLIIANGGRTGDLRFDFLLDIAADGRAILGMSLDPRLIQLGHYDPSEKRESKIWLVTLPKAAMKGLLDPASARRVASSPFPTPNL